MTQPEITLWSKLRSKQVGYKFRRQHGIGNYIVDFYCPEKQIVIEIDGDSHYVNNAQNEDNKKDLYIESLNLKVLRFTNNEIQNNIESVLDKIIESLN